MSTGVANERDDFDRECLAGVAGAGAGDCSQCRGFGEAGRDDLADDSGSAGHGLEAELGVKCGVEAGLGPALLLGNVGESHAAD